MDKSFTNRLIQEKSPYLLQHAHNPVDWYPWGEEAFEKARLEDKPIFLSIGYATCHWCHVMAEESFANPEIAKLLNDAFVNVKVDREEHPQVDSIYMELAQGLMSASGGWPLNLVLTPDLKPFFAVTYLPPEARRGLIGFPQVIQQVKAIWESKEREKLIEQADHVLDMFCQISSITGEVLPSEMLIDKSIEALFEISDPVFGGIKGEPKFPLSYQLIFLLRYAKKHSDSRALFLAELTLDRMARGGIYDQLGGGFSRYSVDGQWVVPHFEKMLYDNALLIEAYTEGFLFTRNPFYRQIIVETINYVLRDLGAKEGGFHSAEDADSEGHEGRFYTWTPAEIKMVLPSPQAERVCLYYGVTPRGNFEGRSVLSVETPLEEIAGQLKMPFDHLRQEISEAKKILFEKRNQRPMPFKDDKILSSWNGLMIHALVRAGEVLQKNEYLEVAKQTIETIKSLLWKDGCLLRRYRDGEAKYTACLEEYASVIKALITLFEAGLGTSYLLLAIEMSDKLAREFRVENGAFYQTDGVEPLLVRKCELYDGAEPSGNAMHAENLLRLYKITGDEQYISQAEGILKAAKILIDAYPPGACYHLLALSRYYALKAPLLVIALDESNSLMEEIKRELSLRQELHLSIVWKYANDMEIAKKIPSLIDKEPLEGRTTLYLCRAHACERPLNDPQEIMNMLGAMKE